VVDESNIGLQAVSSCRHQYLELDQSAACGSFDVMELEAVPGLKALIELPALAAPVSIRTAFNRLLKTLGEPDRSHALDCSTVFHQWALIQLIGSIVAMALFLMITRKCASAAGIGVGVVIYALQ
jgi:hypothetical protein